MPNLPFYQTLGYAGTLPFWIATIALWSGLTPMEPVTLFVYIAAYSGFILSFLGGVHWAHALPRGDKAQMSLAMAPTILALGVMFLPPIVQSFAWPLVILAGCFGGLYVLDTKFLQADWLPEEYFKFRLILTGIVASSLLLSALKFWV